VSGDRKRYMERFGQAIEALAAQGHFPPWD
jgi:hypothetical protein